MRIFVRVNSDFASRGWELEGLLFADEVLME